MLARSCGVNSWQNPGDRFNHPKGFHKGSQPLGFKGDEMNTSVHDTQLRKISISLANAQDREVIYKMRHEVYARELGQHVENDHGRLTDKLDAINLYIVAKAGEEIAGFVSVTPPNDVGYSVDKYFSREELPFSFDEGLYETRILTVSPAWRSSRVAALLMYAALRYIQTLGGKTAVGIGRLEVLDMYKRAGFRSLKRQVRSGKVTFELIAANVDQDRSHFTKLITDLERHTEWNLNGIDFYKSDLVYHGGAFFEAIGEEFDDLARKEEIISADVLDAWFEPAPRVLQALAQNLSWTLRTSPPTGCEGMCRVIARSRGVGEENILPGAGSSDLIFLALRHWLYPRSRVLILDPMYGEYAHVLEKIIGCSVDRMSLAQNKNYMVQPQALEAQLDHGYDWVVLVNPNSPTGQHLPREVLENIIGTAPSTTRFWIDETYVEYAGFSQSLERFAASSRNVVICKSMSKVYALSGVRSAYLCGPADMIEELRPISPPWAVSLPGQIAACEALKSISYYEEKWQETHLLREELSTALEQLGWGVFPSCANFLLCQLPANQPSAADLVHACREQNLFLRDVSNMGKCFDQRTLRIAVKDRQTNGRALQILRNVLAEMGAQTIRQTRVAS
jgi:histidinol-phosphate/aromatic aminotransferase/cobyric acid decarboxylase-like protein/predicted N-acetyltransferase YhbS